MSTVPLIEVIKRQALLTFANRRTNAISFEENLTTLKTLANKLTSFDVKLDRSLVREHSGDFIRDIKTNNFHSSNSAPVTYIEIYDDSEVTIGIFILKSGARLPLHDHPLMYGILKVIYGTIHIKSYSILTSKDESLHSRERNITHHDIALSRDTLNRKVTLLATKEPDMIVNEKDNACVLSPIKGNIHEIHTVDGPAAFVDILSPPYESEIPGVGPRPCRYFKEVGSLNGMEEYKQLVQISSPTDYWSETAPYDGPNIS